MRSTACHGACPACEMRNGVDAAGIAAAKDGHGVMLFRGLPGAAPVVRQRSRQYQPDCSRNAAGQIVIDVDAFVSLVT